MSYLVGIVWVRVDCRAVSFFVVDYFGFCYRSGCCGGALRVSTFKGWGAAKVAISAKVATIANVGAGQRTSLCRAKISILVFPSGVS